MSDSHDRSGRGPGRVLDPHHLLLSLAGLIDDELLGWSRELVGVGETAYALDLISAAVEADRIQLPVAAHAALEAGRSGVRLGQPDPNPVMRHRFVADPAAVGCPPAPGRSPADVLPTLPARLLNGCGLRLTWRLTPAGSSSTPVPHPVLLVETTDRTGSDVLAYQIADLLGRAGVFASVEVLGADSPVGEYHAAAIEASVALEASAPPADTATPADTASPADAARPVPPRPASTSAARTGPPVVGPPAAPRRAPVPAAGPRSPMGPVDRVNTARSAPPAGPIRADATSFAEAARRATQQNRGGYRPVDVRDEPHIREPRGSQETTRRDPSRGAPPQDPSGAPIWDFGPAD